MREGQINFEHVLQAFRGGAYSASISGLPKERQIVGEIAIALTDQQSKRETPVLNIYAEPSLSLRCLLYYAHCDLTVAYAFISGLCC
jgi:hypothetical protein